MQPNKIVIHFKDGSVFKGNTHDFSPDKKIFHFIYSDGKIKEIDVEKLKAIFFVKDPKGDKNHVYLYDDPIAGGGKKVAVDFADGETIIGYALGYSAQRQGFFMMPADLSGNNERIYIVKSATTNIDILAEEEKRKHYRAKTVNPVSYVCVDQDANPLNQGMGTTLDISRGGLLMETKVPIKSQFILLTATDTEEELTRIKGKVVYCREVEPGLFHTGIRFVEANERIRKIVAGMIKAFLQTKAE